MKSISPNIKFKRLIIKKTKTGTYLFKVLNRLIVFRSEYLPELIFDN
jgi:hypothetical protein